MNIKYPLAKETINSEDIDALCEWLKTYPRLTKGALTWEVESKWADTLEQSMTFSTIRVHLQIYL